MSGRMSSRYESIFRADLFKGQKGVYVITGGGSGLGRCIAHELASVGAKVVILGRKIDQLTSVADEINQVYGKATCTPYPLDIRDEPKVTEVVQMIWDKHGPILGLVNNAGGQYVSAAENISPNGWRSVIDLNLNGTWNMTRAVFLSREAASKSPTPENPLANPPLSIVTVLADIRNGKPYMAHTSAARAGNATLSITLAQEWGPRGVRINCVTPGTLIGNGVNNYPETVRWHMTNIHHLNPIGRMGTESEVSSAVVFLMSPAAAYITGTILEVTGGGHLRKGAEDPEPFTENTQSPPYFGFPSLLGGEGSPGYFPSGIPIEFKDLVEKYRKLGGAKL
ncbi:hypothetical protein HDU97_001549 [Phlyctochytrium planicorne]|nr:hypothetical protein HDU97_001549 [Phlyctochytrium planicorne]